MFIYLILISKNEYIIKYLIFLFPRPIVSFPEVFQLDHLNFKLLSFS